LYYCIISIGCWVIAGQPVAFVYWIGNGVEAAESLLECIYFSVVTAATLGCEGYNPKPGIYQGLASLEAIFGTFMWAAFITIFVGKYIRIFANAFLPMILPGIFVFSVIIIFGWTLDSLIAIILLTQIYIIWGQFEVAGRQARVSLLEYEPIFDIDLKGPEDESKGLYIVRVKHLGKHPVKNFLISTEIEGKSQKHSPDSVISIFSPGDTISPTFLITPDFFESEIVIILNYVKMSGDVGIYAFRKRSYSRKFLLAGEVSRNMPGLLLNSMENLSLIIKEALLSRKIKLEKETFITSICY
jgi:hypothetical protein